MAALAPRCQRMFPDFLKLPGRRDSVRVARRDIDRISHLLSCFEGGDGRMHLLPRLGGGAAQFLTFNVAATALTNAQVAFLGPLVGIEQAALTLGMAIIPTITAQTAAATIVINFNRTDTPAVIGGTTYLTPTAGTVNSAPVSLFCIVPFGIPAVNGISVSASDTAQTAIPTGSATRPMILAALGLT